jgi:HEPN domain-containing protein
VNSSADVKYRLNLAKGFHQEAEEDFQLGRWRSCVHNSQLCVENSGKAILMLFGVPSKTHEPAKHLAQLVKNAQIPSSIRGRLKEFLPDFLTLGVEEHFMTDYGDETSYKLPWELFDEESALAALESARKCKSAAEEVVELTRRWRLEKSEEDA